VGSRQWAAGSGQQTVDSRHWAAGSGQQTVGSRHLADTGQQTLGSRHWAAQWEADSGQRALGIRHWAADTGKQIVETPRKGTVGKPPRSPCTHVAHVRLQRLHVRRGQSYSLIILLATNNISTNNMKGKLVRGQGLILLIVPHVRLQRLILILLITLIVPLILLIIIVP
jgi:hypothetical protein